MVQSDFKCIEHDLRGCIGTVKKSVAGLQGTANVNVDLASSTAEVLYDSNIITDPQTIANAITNSGYPAKIRKLISSQQLKRETIEVSKNAKTDIAKVGRINIARKDFEIELDHARSRYQKIYGTDTFSTPKGRQLLQRIQTQIALRLVDEAIKLQEIDRAAYTIQDDKIKDALTKYAKEKNITLDQLKSDLEANGYPFDHFKKKFGQRVKLQTYLEEEILSGSIDPDDRQQRYGNWLSNARALATVVYYDKNLEALVKAGSGAGCSGGGSGGGGVVRCPDNRFSHFSFRRCIFHSQLLQKSGISLFCNNCHIQSDDDEDLKFPFSTVFN